MEWHDGTVLDTNGSGEHKAVTGQTVDSSMARVYMNAYSDAACTLIY